MVSCKHCATPNSLDSTFCKRCGTSLPEEDIKAGEVKLEAMLAEGESALNDGKTENSMAIAEMCVLANPSSVRALSLKSMCHERMGQIADALEAAEKIVELNPDSELDKIRRNQLRNSLLRHAMAPPVNRQRALLGAVAAFALCLSLGAIAATIVKRNNDHQNTAQNEPFKQNSPVQQVSLQPQQPPSQASNSQTMQTPVNPPNNNGAGQQNYTAPTPQPNTRGQLPFVQGDLGTSPINPPGPPEGNTTKNPDTKKGTDPDPTENPPNPNKMVSNQGSDADENPGVIEINVSNHGGKRAGNSGSESVGGNGLSAMMHAASQQFQTSNFSAAATTYERALRNGADPITVNQRLGQSYERSGRTSDAIAAYKRSQAACESALASGKGDRSRIESTLATCKQYLKVLQGG